MPDISETAYPRLKSNITQKDLNKIFSPMLQEINFVTSITQSDTSKLWVTVMLKAFGRLGYFPFISQIPAVIVNHISSVLDVNVNQEELLKYDNTNSRKRHMNNIRRYLNINRFDETGRALVINTITEAAKVKDDVCDLINIAVEELVRHNFELPAFNTLVRLVNNIKVKIYDDYYNEIYNLIGENERNNLDKLFEVDFEKNFTEWYYIKVEPGKPTVNNIKEMINRIEWLSKKNVCALALEKIPDIKIQQFANEARTLDSARLKSMESKKRYALIVSLLFVQSTTAVDDLVEMFIKKMMNINRKAKQELEKSQLESIKKSDELISKLKDIVIAYKMNENPTQRLAAIDTIIGDDAENVLNNCEAHLATLSNNNFPFMWRFYKSHRLAFINILKTVKIYSTTQNTSLEKSINFIVNNKIAHRDFIDTIKIINKGKENEQRIELLDITWIPDSWWKFVTEQNKKSSCPEKINRRHFELCIFFQIMIDLKSGDLYVEGSNNFSDYRNQLISWEEYTSSIDLYSEQVGLPLKSDEFIKHTKNWLESAINETDKSFPTNHYLEIKNGEPTLHKIKKKKEPSKLKFLETYIADHLISKNILDMLADTEYWLNWTRFFRPASGYEGKLENPIKRYLTTTFCYGCNLGPTQTASSLDNINRKQVAWINQRHIDEDKLNSAIKLVVNSYNWFTLPKYWGSGNRVSADGTKWDIYEENLLSEYHIRYGGYGGIGYYHVSDTYIALFSHFIPCGVWEAVYILDGLLKNQSDIRPDTIHADTQGQNSPVFAFSYLLGINLMPRIRNWKDLKFYRPDSNKVYKHINDLFSDTIDWELIKTFLPDMLRVILSIKAGKITASAILRRLSNYSRKNKLYLAFRELGRVIRTGFLMQYLRDEDLRSTIQATTNKSEAFNGFAKWISFGGNEIKENNRLEQRKIIKYNHLISNCLIFYNVYSISLILNEYVNEGHELTESMLSSLSPYITQHINRFGKYELDIDRKPEEINYNVLHI